MREIPRLIVALDVDSVRDVETILRQLGPRVDFYKVGLKLFTHYGPDVLKLLKRRRKRVFLDLKLHDIPNTVAGACREAVRHKIDMLTLHASGGGEMLRAAAQATREESRSRKIPPPLLMGVTVLTSMDSLVEIGIRSSPALQVLRLAALAKASGLDGVICSPHEIAALRSRCGRRFKIVTPGVRPAGSAAGDQKRVKTPEQAFALGADAVVVGRPILEAEDPRQVARGILAKSDG